MQPVLQASLGGWIARTGRGRLHCHRPGWLFSGLTLLAALACAGGGVAIVMLHARNGLSLPSLLVALLAGAAALSLWLLFAFRWRRMGSFLIDVQAGTLRHFHGHRVVAQWPLSDVRFATARDPWALQSWVVARVPDGRGLRLGKATAAENESVLRLLEAWGLRVETGAAQGCSTQ